MPGPRSRRASLRERLIMSATLGGLMVAGYGRQAYAQCAGGGGTFSCSGALTNTQALSGSPLTVTTENGFSIDTTSPPGSGGSAFTLTATGGLTFTDNTAGGAAITGAASGIEAQNHGNGILSITASGPVTGSGIDGIAAYNGANAGDVTIVAASVSGGNDGISAFNNGIGSLSITATGAVTGGGKYGIAAYNASTASGLTIAAAEVTGNDFGISAINNGAGALSITADGTVTGASEHGIYAQNGFASATNLTISAAAVAGSVHGISASNHGGGALKITASGAVNADAGNGVLAKNYGAGDLTISTAAVTAGNDGIDATNRNGAALSITSGAVTGNNGNGVSAVNEGTGALTITATGAVAGIGGDGIYANNSVNSGGGLVVHAAGVSGKTDGIDSLNRGLGPLSITANGVVSGENGRGINAVNHGAGGLSISASNTVTGGDFGILAANYGAGALVITSINTVTGNTDGGIKATNNGSHLTITAVNVTSGGYAAIFAENRGNGDLSVTTIGAVTGTADIGIFAHNVGSGGLSVAADGAVAGSNYGIQAINFGTSLTISVDVDGAVEGATAGVDAQQFGNSLFQITNHGTIRNTSGSPGDLAIKASSTGAGLTISNTSSNSILGRLTLTAMNDTFVNTGLWENTGTSDFGGGSDSLANHAGATIRVSGTASWSSLENFSNQGLLTFGNGDANDMLTISGDFTGGGTIAIDVDLPYGLADKLTVLGSASGGQTTVNVNTLRGVVAPIDHPGIPVITVAGAGKGDFVADTPGIYVYDLVLGGSGAGAPDTWYLQLNTVTTSAGTVLPAIIDPAFVYLTVQPAAHALGRDLVGTLWERVGLRESQYAQDGLAGGRNRDEFGAWLRFSAARIDSDGALKTPGTSPGASYDSDQWLMQGGVDGLLHADAAGRLVGSLFAHWGRSDTHANALDGSDAGTVDLDAYGGGAALTWYGTSGLYFDLLGQVSAYEVDMASVDEGHIGKPDGYGIAASFEVGFAAEVMPNLRLVPQAQLVYQRIVFDDATDDLGKAIAWDASNSVEGRLGLAVETGRIGGSGTGFFAYADANLIYDLLDPDGVSIGGDHIAFDRSSTSVELGGGVNLVSAEQAVTYNLYLDGDVRLPVDGDGTTIVQGTAGFRLDW